MVPLTPLQRKAAFAAAVELHETTKSAAATDLGVSWTHLLLCFEGARVPSEELMQRVADYVAIDRDHFWPPRQPAAAAS
jgi:hypothetical protein